MNHLDQINRIKLIKPFASSIDIDNSAKKKVQANLGKTVLAKKCESFVTMVLFTDFS